MRKRSKRLIPFSLAVISYAGWLLFTAQFASHELILGAGCALLTTYATASAWRRMRVPFRPTFRQLLTGWRIPWNAITGSWEMMIIVVRALTGIQSPGSHYRAASFHLAPGSRGVAQSILATAYITATPVSVVIGADGQNLLFHQIERGSIPHLITDLESAR